MPDNLKTLGAQKKDFGQIAQNALHDICSVTNPKQPTAEDIISILEKAY